MKVVFAARNILPFHSFCGTGRYVHGLAKHLAKLGVEIEIIAPPEAGGKGRRERVDGIDYTFIPPQVVGSRFFGFYRSYHLHNIRAYQHLKKIDFDLLHMFEINGFPYLSRRNRKPVVVSPFHRGTEPWKERHLSKKVGELPIDLPLKYCLTRCDAVASEGPVQSERLIERFGLRKEKIIELPDGVDLNLIREYGKNPALSREKYGLNRNNFIVICVGRLDPQKGVTYLIDAFSLLKKKVENSRLILIGVGSEEERIKKLISETGLTDSVLHFRNVSDEELVGFYNISDVFASPTLYEGLPQVILEAMASSLPIVATNTGENTQVVENWVNGLLVKPADANALVEALSQMYDSGKGVVMGRKSKEKIISYDWEIIAKKALREYEKITA